jgi:hypothetical protein
MQKQSRDCIECSSLATVCDTKGVAVATVSKFPCVFTLAASTEVSFNFFIGFFSVGTPDSSSARRRLFQTAASLPSARGECYYSEARFPILRHSSAQQQSRLTMCNAVLQSIENGIVQKACDVWISSVGSFSADSANLMLREFLLSFSTDDNTLPSGVVGVTAVYVGSGIPSQLTISFSTSACGAGIPQPFLFRVRTVCDTLWVVWMGGRQAESLGISHRVRVRPGLCKRRRGGVHRVQREHVQAHRLRHRQVPRVPHGVRVRSIEPRLRVCGGDPPLPFHTPSTRDFDRGVCRKGSRWTKSK